jgi:hydroxymethylpyrimidine pyrophosphatase-like HAD family hydrolase
MSFETTDELKQLLIRKLYIFDLDECLWDGKKIYPGVLDILKELQLNGHMVYIASFNLDVPGVLDYLGITNMFHGGAYSADIKRLRTKYDMIKEIIYHVLHKHKHITIHVEFYDDQMSNIREVHTKSNGWVRAVHVKQPYGLKKEHLDSDAPLSFV